LSGGLFGSNLTAKANSGSLFGTNTGKTGLFGAAQGGGGLFGNVNKDGKSNSGGLFGGNGTTGGLFSVKPLFGGPSNAPAGGSIFQAGNSLFGPKPNIFAKQGTEQSKDDESDDDVGKGGDSPPAFAPGGLKDVPTAASPFAKVFEKDIQKFKIAVPAAKKRNCGQGKV